MNLKSLSCLILIYSFPAAGLSQDRLSDKIIDFPSSFFTRVNNKTANLEARLTKQTERYLQRLAKCERRLKRRISKVDSVATQRLFENSEQKYAQLTSMVSQISPSTGVGRGDAEYLPIMDSLKSSLSFLQQNNLLTGNNAALQRNVQGSLTSINRLQNKLEQTDKVKAFIQQRKQQLKDALGKYTNLPGRVTNSITDFNKEAYYYSAQVKEYKDMLKEPDRMVEKGLSLLSTLPAFQQFMQQHSQLASLFRLPDNYGNGQSLAGLQTRAQVQQQIQTQLAAAGPNAPQYVQQNMQAAQSQLNQLKDKINKLGGGSGDMDMPGFKPNNQKTKTFWRRLEYGTNFQTARSNFFPVTSDLGLSVGYKLTDNSTIGVGASYKMGWGKDIRHISITHEGIGLRSYLDMKLKGSFYASGGYEHNYQPRIPSINSGSGDILKGEEWTQSGLIGVSKVISVKSNFLKKTKVQLLWDFLSYQQVPRTQALKFRVGYNF